MVVVLAPLAFVALTSLLGLGSGDRLLRNVRISADLATDVVDSAPEDRWEEELTSIARRKRVRIRLLDEPDDVRIDVDYQRDLIPGPVELAVLLDMRDYDQSLGPLGERPEVAVARISGDAAACRTTDGAESLVCHAVRTLAPTRSQIVYVQDTAPRSIRALYEARYPLLRLTLFILPGALVLALWLGWRLVRPVEELREQLLAKTRLAAPGAPLQIQRGDEFGDLAAAFNTLLERLDERSRANEGFVADLAHEFKNPVASIRAVAESLAAGQPDPQRAARLARVLGDSSRRLEGLLDQLLALARAEAGLANEERVPVELDHLLAGLVESQGVRSPGVTFHTDLTPGVTVVAVAHGVEGALRNLLDNAADFAPQGNVWVTARAQGNAVRIEVADDGPGIADGEWERVFDRFYSTRSGKRGTGLGLALVRAVIEAHGGRVWAEPAERGGAAFHVRLPTGGG